MSRDIQVFLLSYQEREWKNGYFLSNSAPRKAVTKLHMGIHFPEISDSNDEFFGF